MLGHPAINATNLNPIPIKWKIGRRHLTITLIIEKKKNICHRCGDDLTLGDKCRNNQTIPCRIINGKEVQVSAPEISFDSNTDTNSK